MKKFLFLLIPFLFLSCTNNISDDPDSLPYVDISKYKSADSLVFPKGTYALDVYTCLLNKYGEGDFDINATYTYTETAILNGNVYTDTLIKNITSVTISRIDSAPTIENLRTCTAEFHTDKNESIILIYKWYRYCDNSWENTILNGEIFIK